MDRSYRRTCPTLHVRSAGPLLGGRMDLKEDGQLTVLSHRSHCLLAQKTACLGFFNATFSGSRMDCSFLSSSLSGWTDRLSGIFPKAQATSVSTDQSVLGSLSLANSGGTTDASPCIPPSWPNPLAAAACTSKSGDVFMVSTNRGIPSLPRLLIAPIAWFARSHTLTASS